LNSGDQTAAADSSTRLHGFSIRLARGSARLRSDLTFTFIDAVTVAISYIAAFGLRGLDEPSVVVDYRFGFLILLPIIVISHLVTNFIFGVYGHEWEHASVEEAMRLLGASVAAGVAMIATLISIQGFTGATLRLVPIGVVVMGSAFALGGMGAVRFRARMFSFRRVQEMAGAVPTLVIGTGHAAAELARKGVRGHHAIDVVGFLSASSGYSHRRIADLPVLGSLEDVVVVVDSHGIEQVLIAHPLEAAEIRDLIDTLLEIDVRLRIVPQLEDVLGANARLLDVRDVSVTDLLPRPVVSTDLSEVSAFIAGKRVLVTGAGGSIGTEITKQVLRYGPEAVFAMDHDETHLHDGSASWEEQEVVPTPVLCDIRDSSRLGQLFGEIRPHIVFHAAAHKHVPILERYPDEAVKTNILGTHNVLEACQAHGVQSFVLISTDKAVEPTSAMGASKRIAEMLTQSAAEISKGRCIHTAVRFGNVLGSRGSVVPTFRRQIQAGGPVTVTDPNMLRYFMTVDEAVQLVLQSAAHAGGGEVFVLDMGEPVRIGDLARRMIRLAGLVPGRDIEVKVTGARPGEKQVEILSVNPLDSSAVNKIQVARPGHPGRVTLLEMVEHLSKLSTQGMSSEIREFLLGIAHRQWQPDEIVNLTSLSDLFLVQADEREAG
jgi:FlaA1/EpsC-like NDP-sugar epimerase